MAGKKYIRQLVDIHAFHEKVIYYVTIVPIK